jgi:ribosomal protein S18 acetylase RimI-like enzyme
LVPWRPTNVIPYAPLFFVPVTRLWHDAFHDAFPALADRFPRPRFERYFRDVVVARDDVWVVERQARVVGFMALRGDYLSHLFVDPAHQRTGVGTALVTHAMRVSPEGLSLHVSAANARALRFYGRLGFSVGAGVAACSREGDPLEVRWAPDAGAPRRAAPG